MTHLPGLDLTRLHAYLTTERPGLVTGELRGQVIAGGRSNLTYRITDGHSHWVLRRPPLGHVLPTAHDMAREHRVISALAPTPVPVPQTLLLCPDPDVIGAPFYLMAFVPGTPYHGRAQLAELGPERTRRIAMSLIDTLVDLHEVDPAAAGLADFGRPQGFLERQLRRWARQLDASRSRELPAADELRDRLAATLPAGAPATIVHGDYRLDNVLVDGDDRITAVLDWEMSTLGDPLTDLALMVVYSGGEMPTAPGGSTAYQAPGYPTPKEIVARYAERSGRDVSALNWYVSLAFFKLGAILEGIHYRFVQGRTVGEDFDRIGTVVPALFDAGLRHLPGD